MWKCKLVLNTIWWIPRIIKKSLERRDLWNEQEIIKGKGSYWNRCNLLFIQNTTFFYVQKYVFPPWMLNWGLFNTALQHQVSVRSGEYFSTVSLFEMAIFHIIGSPSHCANIESKCLKSSFVNKIYIIRHIMNASKDIEICTCGVNGGSLRQIKRLHH